MGGSGLSSSHQTQEQPLSAQKQTLLHLQLYHLAGSGRAREGGQSHDCKLLILVSHK